ncbi:unnamed protein product, partial [marine sediment metagenome]
MESLGNKLGEYLNMERDSPWEMYLDFVLVIT